MPEHNETTESGGLLFFDAYSFSSLFILDVATQSQKDHKLFSTTYILCNIKIGN